MKYLNAILIILLNILFCVILLWFFSRNAYLRPYLGSTAKEFLSGLLLLATLYTNFFVLYPKLCKRHSSLYWLSVVLVALTAAVVEMAVGCKFIASCNEYIISKIGLYEYFAKLLLLVFGRNLAFNFFPFMLRDRKHLQQSLETEIKVVYQYARMIDVCDREMDCQHISIDNILYCQKNENETNIYTVDNTKFTRYCSLKYLIQLLDNNEFIRISSSFVIPFQYIASCDGKTVVMKNMPWTVTPLTFQIDTKRYPLSPYKIKEYLQETVEERDSKPQNCEQKKSKRNPSSPPKNKLNVVLKYINTHPGCRSTELVSHTKYPISTIERCLSCLKKQGFIEYIGCKKTGGYHLVNILQENEASESVQQEKACPVSY